jgi:hypothetical protein
MKKFTYVSFRNSIAIAMILMLPMLVLANSITTIPPPTQLIPAEGVHLARGADGISGKVQWRWDGVLPALGGAFIVEQREVDPEPPLLANLYTIGWDTISNMVVILGSQYHPSYQIPVSGLVNGKTYEWRVTAIPTNNVDYSNSTAAVSGPEPIVVLTGSIGLTWNEEATNNSVTIIMEESVTGETGFQTFYRANSSGPWKITAKYPFSGTSSITTKFLQAATVYEIYVVASDANGNKVESNHVLAKTKRDKASPPLYFNVGTVCPYTADLLFSFSNPEQFDYFRILDGANTLFSSYTRTINVATISLIPNTTYNLVLEQVNESGSTYTNLPLFTTSTVQGPDGASNFSGPGNVTTTSMDVAWVNGLEDIACNNKIREEIELAISVVNRDGSTESYTIGAGRYDTFKRLTNFQPKSKVTIVHRSVNHTLGKIGYTQNTITGVTLGPPYAPSDGAGVAGKDALKDDEIVISWIDNADDENGTIIEIGDGQGGFKYLATIDKNITKFVHKPVQEGVTYIYRIKSFNEYGDSYYSNEFSVTPNYTVEPNAPFNLSAAMGDGVINLSWQDDSQKENVFEIDRSTNAGLTWTKIGEVARNVTKFSDSDVTSGTEYWYGVRAKNEVGASDRVTAYILYGTTTASARVTVFPNPTVDLINLRVENASNGTISLINQSNRRVLSKSVNFANGDLSLDMSGFAPGAYQLIINLDDKKISRKIYKY